MQPISSCIHLPDVQLDAALDVVDGLDEVIIESCQPPLIMPHIELVQLLQHREACA